MALGVVTDVGTALTFGAASAPLQALKTGVKIGVKFGIKAGLKGTVNVAKTSLKTALKKTVSLGLKSGTEKAITKAGKFIAKEVVIDPAVFLKNVGKLSKQILLRPKATINSLIGAGTKSVESLKKLKKKLLKEKKTPNPCKRSPFFCKKKPKLDMKEAESVFETLKTGSPTAEQLELTSKRYLTYNEKTKALFDKWRLHFRSKGTDDPITLDNWKPFQCISIKTNPR